MNKKCAKLSMFFLALSLILTVSSCNIGGLTGPLGFVVKTTAADEDYVDFGTMENFTASGDWAVIEKVKLPDDYTTGGWHVFRGKAWEDKEGDIAISLRPDQVYGWLFRSGYGWYNLGFDATFHSERWYTICMQYDSDADTLSFYVDGSLRDSESGVPMLDDSGNTNKLFFGGQDVDAGWGEGDLYTEADIVIAHQAWFQRTLSTTEISKYDGTLDAVADLNLFFETSIDDLGISDVSGGGHNGTNGNSPEFFLDQL